MLSMWSKLKIQSRHIKSADCYPLWVEEGSWTTDSRAGLIIHVAASVSLGVRPTLRAACSWTGVQCLVDFLGLLKWIFMQCKKGKQLVRRWVYVFPTIPRKRELKQPFTSTSLRLINQKTQDLKIGHEMNMLSKYSFIFFLPPVFLYYSNKYDVNYSCKKNTST